jgi:PilZ domain-containing protein
MVKPVMDSLQERPRFGRVSFQARVILRLLTPEISVEANALDISASGVCVICSEPLAVGENAFVAFQFRNRTEVEVEEVRGRVIRVRMDDDVWVLGLQFDEILDWQKTPLLARATASGEESLRSNLCRVNLPENRYRAVDAGVVQVVA